MESRDDVACEMQFFCKLIIQNRVKRNILCTRRNIMTTGVYYDVIHSQCHYRRRRRTAVVAAAAAVVAAVRA